MNRKFAGAGIAGVVLYIGFGSAFDTAQAACRQMLAPNSWQYITVCDGNRGSNYSGAISAGVAAAGIAAELLPGILENLGDVTSGVGDITSNVAPNFSNPLENFLSSANQHGSQNDGTLNPFNIFNQQPEAPAAKTKNAKQDETPSLFPNIFAPQVNAPAPTINTPHVNTPAPQANAPTVNTPLFPNIFAPQVNTAAPRVNSPQVRTPAAPQVYDPTIAGR